MQQVFRASSKPENYKQKKHQVLKQDFRLQKVWGGKGKEEKDGTMKPTEE